MTDKILNVAPRFDDVTEYSIAWSKDFLAQADSTEITSLLEKDAIKSKFRQEIDNHDVFIFFDHGNEEGLIDNNSQYLIRTSDAFRLNGKKVFAMACLSAKKFGKKAFEEGCVEYWGAVESIGFTVDEATLFGEVFVVGAYDRFITEKDVDVVYDSMLAHFLEQIGKTDNPWAKIWLQKDHDMWVVWYEDNPPPNDESKTWWQLLIEWIKKMIGWDFQEMWLIQD